jgi:lipoyl(octanoyl) transferase
MKINVHNYGLIDYQEGLDLQNRLHQEVLVGRSNGEIIVCQHPPTITLGKHGSDKDILAPEKILKEHEIQVFRCERGGKLTYHGPGQLVVYPILRLTDFRLGIRRYVHLLEDTCISQLDDIGITGTRKDNDIGIFVRDESVNDPVLGLVKIASLGIRVSRGITSHGIAVNLNNDLSPFNLFVPCGMTAGRLTNAHEIIGNKIDLERFAGGFTEKLISALTDSAGKNK